MSYERPIWYILDDNNNPIPTNAEGASKILRNVERRRVAIDTFGPYTVSTIFLVIDHNMTLKGPPLLFNTVIFKAVNTNEHFSKGLPCFEVQYINYQQAVEGHAATVEAVKLGLLPKG
jgi:hypothetical protein